MVYVTYLNVRILHPRTIIIDSGVNCSERLEVALNGIEVILDSCFFLIAHLCSLSCPIRELKEKASGCVVSYGSLLIGYIIRGGSWMPGSM